MTELAKVLARQGRDLSGWVKKHVGKKMVCGQAHAVVDDWLYFTWMPVTSWVSQGAILGCVLFNVFISDLEDVTECTCTKFADDTKLGVLVDMPEGRAVIRGTDVSSTNGLIETIKFRKDKCKVSNLGRKRPLLPATGWECQAREQQCGQSLWAP